jgi:hypothetical protein
LPLLRDVGAQALSLDTTDLRPRTWEGIAVALESGLDVYAGCVPTLGQTLPAADIAGELVRRWDELGLDPAGLAALGVSPSCGLAGMTTADAVARQGSAVEVARRLENAAA